MEDVPAGELDFVWRMAECETGFEAAWGEYDLPRLLMGDGVRKETDEDVVDVSGDKGVNLGEKPELSVLGLAEDEEGEGVSLGLMFLEPVISFKT